MTQTAACPCETPGFADRDRPNPICASHGLDLTTVEGTAAALRFAGIEVGSVGGETVRLHYASHLLPLIEAKFAAVWREAYAAGVNDERTSVDMQADAGPNRVNPYEKRT